jgi:hypothetical protein
MAVNCPHCGLVSPPDAQRCECGYDLGAGRRPESGAEETRAGQGMIYVLRPLLIILAAILGLPLGAVLAGVVTYYGCVALGGKAVQVGWIFLFVTVPGGAVLGSVLAALLVALMTRTTRKRRASP